MMRASASSIVYRFVLSQSSDVGHPDMAAGWEEGKRTWMSNWTDHQFFHGDSVGLVWRASRLERNVPPNTVCASAGAGATRQPSQALAETRHSQTRTPDPGTHETASTEARQCGIVGWTGMGGCRAVGDER